MKPSKTKIISLFMKLFKMYDAVNMGSEHTEYSKQEFKNMPLGELFDVINEISYSGLCVDDLCVFSCDIEELPNCCGAFVIGAINTSDNYQKGTIEILWELYRMYTDEFLFLATTINNEESTPMNTILEKLGWKESHRWINPNTANELILWTYVNN